MPPKRQYRPGSRDPRHRPQDGKLGENRHAWLRTVIGQFIINLHHGDDDENKKEGGPDVQLYLPRPYGRPISFNLSSLTHEEFILTRQFFDMLFDLAEPVVIERDKVASDAFANGDDSYARCYRQIPQLVIRPREVRANGQGLHDGPEDDASGPEDDGDLEGGLRGDGDALAAGQPEDRGSEDLRTEIDSPEGVRQVGGLGRDADGLLSADPGEGDSTPAP